MAATGTGLRGEPDWADYIRIRLTIPEEGQDVGLCCSIGKCWDWGQVLSSQTTKPPGECEIWGWEWAHWGDCGHLSDGLQLPLVSMRTKTRGRPGWKGSGTQWHEYGLEGGVSWAELGFSAQ